MPRKAKTVKGATSQAATEEPEPQPTLTEDQQAEASKSGPKGRDTDGKYTKGNSGGPGNPHARACARMLQAFRDNITEEEMLQICRMLYVKAVGGDISAAKIILSYKIGKPLPAPHPDSIDRDEWDHYQNDAIHEKEMKRVMTALPTQAGNDIVRVSLPIMTASRLNEFAAHLVESLPTKMDEGKAKKKGEKSGTSDPIANGNSGRECAEQAERTKTKEAAKKDEGGRRKDEGTTKPDEPIANGKSDCGYAEKTAKTNTREAPIANGKKGRVAKAKIQRKKAKPHWLRPLAKQLQGSETE